MVRVEVGLLIKPEESAEEGAEQGPEQGVEEGPEQGAESLIIPSLTYKYCL
jgi:flagellar biosynthesis/type III secretory pathway protein FliH